MRIRGLATAFAMMAWAGAAHADALEDAWRGALADGSREIGFSHHAILKIQDRAILAVPGSASVVGKAGDAASYHFEDGVVDGAVLVMTHKDGKLIATMGGLSFDEAHLAHGVTIDGDIDIEGHASDHSSGSSELTVYNQRRAAAVNFKGLDYFPYDPAYRVTATFKPDPVLPMRMFRVSAGADRPYYHTGDATFALNGKTLTLPFYSFTTDPGKIDSMDAFFLDDLTGHGAYGSGRYLNVSGFGTYPPTTFTIDFNYAYNPLCARSEYYSCPIAIDVLATAVQAGEKDPHQAH